MEYPINSEKRKRRQHSAAFKQQVVEACQRPGTSVAAVALAHGLNANLLRRWLKSSRKQPANVDTGRLAGAASPDHRAIIPVVVAPPGEDSSDAIRISIERQGTSVEISWPVGQAKACSEWLRELLR
jgi:transposase-like protein